MERSQLLQRRGPWYAGAPRPDGGPVLTVELPGVETGCTQGGGVVGGVSGLWLAERLTEMVKPQEEVWGNPELGLDLGSLRFTIP